MSYLNYYIKLGDNMCTQTVHVANLAAFFLLKKDNVLSEFLSSNLSIYNHKCLSSLLIKKDDCLAICVLVMR